MALTPPPDTYIIPAARYLTHYVPTAREIEVPTQHVQTHWLGKCQICIRRIWHRQLKRVGAGILINGRSCTNRRRGGWERGHSLKKEDEKCVENHVAVDQ